MNSTLDILAITGPIYLAIALGYAFTRQGVFSRADMLVFGKFTINLALPALLFNALSQRSLAEILNAQYMLAYALGSLLMILAGLWWTRKVQGHSLSYSSMLTMGMSCPNSGFVGYPIMLLTLGPVAGVALALNMVVENLLMIPLLLAVADAQGGTPGQWRAVLWQTLKNLLKNPMILGIAGGFLFALSGLPMPLTLGRTINLFAQASAALSLFVIGGTLVGLQVQGLRWQVAQIALGKLVLHPVLVLGAALLAPLLGLPVLEGDMRTAAVLMAAMPMMGIFPILAQRYGQETLAAAALLVATVASFFTLSGLLWLLRQWPQ